MWCWSCWGLLLLSTRTTHEVDAGRVRLYMGVVGSGHCSFCLLARIKDIHDCQWSGGFPLVNDGSLCVNMRYSMWSVGQSHTPLTHRMRTQSHPSHITCTPLALTYHMCMCPSHPSHITSHPPHSHMHTLHTHYTFISIPSPSTPLHTTVNRGAMGRCLFLRVEIVNKGATSFVIFSEAANFPLPFRLENFSQVCHVAVVGTSVSMRV